MIKENVRYQRELQKTYLIVSDCEKELLENYAGKMHSKSMIIEHVWEYNFDPETTIVETRIYKLREKIDKPFERELIHTVRGIGYVLE